MFIQFDRFVDSAGSTQEVCMRRGDHTIARIQLHGLPTGQRRVVQRSLLAVHPVFFEQGLAKTRMCTGVVRVLSQC